MKIFRWGLIAWGTAVAVIAFAWFYTSVQLVSARANGVYSTPEEAMRSMAEEYYSADRSVKILYAGTNSFNGSQPHIWYVIAEVRATSRADGSSLRYQGCEAPGVFFIQTKDGWVYVPEGAFPEFIGFWMKVFGWAGEGQSTPSTDWAPDQPKKFCQ
jgi:hypothetical protein